MTLVERYTRFWSRREPAESLALVRILVGLVVLYDLVQVGRLGLVAPLWAPIEDGGIGPATYAEPITEFYAWVGASLASTRVLFALALATASTLALGLYTRLSAFVLMFAYAQLSRLSPNADRGIDILLRNVLAVLACSGAGAVWSINAWRTRAWQRAWIPAWPRYLLITQLVLLYFWAGILKQSAAWTSLSGYRALSDVLQMAHYARFGLPHALLAQLYPLFQLGTCATVWFERAAPLIPILIWLRTTRDRGGWLRAIVVRGRLFELWVTTGATFHLLLAALLKLGIFPWGCLALYPAWFAPSSVRAVFERLRQLLHRLCYAPERSYASSALLTRSGRGAGPDQP